MMCGSGFLYFKDLFELEKVQRRPVPTEGMTSKLKLFTLQ